MGIDSLEVKSGEMSFFDTTNGKKMGVIGDVDLVSYDVSIEPDSSGKLWTNKEFNFTTEMGLPKKLLYLLLGIKDDKNSHMALYNKRKRIRNKYNKRLVV